MSRLRFTLALMALLGACRTPPPEPVPLSGDAAALARLVGEWAGSYDSPQTGRSGSIVFTLAAGEDHAHGDVMMIPRGMNEPLRALRADPGGMRRDTASARLLRIVFVRASGDSVSGTLDPYQDPQCSCAASTSFRGRLAGNRIEGSFVTVRTGAEPVRGSWMVMRRN
jgi:hypothetical protein